MTNSLSGFLSSLPYNSRKLYVGLKDPVSDCEIYFPVDSEDEREAQRQKKHFSQLLNENYIHKDRVPEE